jgi:uncharacterized protein (TIGR00162 family)
MKNTKIFYNKKNALRDPILIVGLPGIGTVGSLVGEHLRNELKAKKFATLYSPHFLHQAIMLKNGGVRLVSNRFYVFENKKTGRSILILVGDMQSGSPEGQYEINDKVVRFFKSLGGRTIYTIGGYNIGNQYVHHPRVFGVATDKETRLQLSKHGIIFGKAAGAIWGSAGLIIAFSKRYKMHGACIMGETGMLEVDANAAKAVLEVLKGVLNLDVNLDNIDKIKNETEKLLKELEGAAAGNTDPSQASGGNGGKQHLSYIR